MMSGHVNKMLLTIGYDLVSRHYLDVQSHNPALLGWKEGMVCQVTHEKAPVTQ
jgi:hypothetical protein